MTIVARQFADRLATLTAGLVPAVGVAAAVWWGTRADPPPRPAPLFADSWDDRRAPPPSLDGEWSALVTDERFERGANPCVLKFQSGPDGALRVRAEAPDGSWRSWGEGSADGRRIRFRWTGDRGWIGTADLELDEGGRSMRGTFVREGVDRVEYARAERR